MSSLLRHMAVVCYQKPRFVVETLGKLGVHQKKRQKTTDDTRKRILFLFFSCYNDFHCLLSYCFCLLIFVRFPPITSNLSSVDRRRLALRVQLHSVIRNSIRDGKFPGGKRAHCWVPSEKKTTKTANQQKRYLRGFESHRCRPSVSLVDEKRKKCIRFFLTFVKNTFGGRFPRCNYSIRRNRHISRTAFDSFGGLSIFVRPKIKGARTYYTRVKPACNVPFARDRLRSSGPPCTCFLLTGHDRAE